MKPPQYEIINKQVLRVHAQAEELGRKEDYVSKQQTVRCLQRSAIAYQYQPWEACQQ